MIYIILAITFVAIVAYFINREERRDEGQLTKKELLKLSKDGFFDKPKDTQEDIFWTKEDMYFF